MSFFITVFLYVHIIKVMSSDCLFVNPSKCSSKSSSSSKCSSKSSKSSKCSSKSSKKCCHTIEIQQCPPEEEEPEEEEEEEEQEEQEEMNVEEEIVDIKNDIYTMLQTLQSSTTEICELKSKVCKLQSCLDKANAKNCKLEKKVNLLTAQVSSLLKCDYDNVSESDCDNYKHNCGTVCTSSNVGCNDVSSCDHKIESFMEAVDSKVKILENEINQTKKIILLRTK